MRLLIDCKSKYSNFVDYPLENENVKKSRGENAKWVCLFMMKLAYALPNPEGHWDVSVYKIFKSNKHTIIMTQDVHLFQPMHELQLDDTTLFYWINIYFVLHNLLGLFCLCNNFVKFAAFRIIIVLNTFFNLLFFFRLHY